MYNFDINSHGLKRSDATTISANDLMLMLLNAETGQRGYVITGDDTFLDVYYYGLRNIPPQIVHLTNLTRNTSDNAIVADVNSLIFDKMAELQRTIDARKSSGFETAQSIVQDGSGKRIMDTIRTKLSVLNTNQHQLLNLYRKYSDKFARGAIGGMTLLVISFFWIAVTMSRSPSDE